MSRFYEAGKLASLADLGIMGAAGAGLGAAGGAIGAPEGHRLEGAGRGALLGGALGAGGAAAGEGLGHLALSRLSEPLANASMAAYTLPTLAAAPAGYFAGHSVPTGLERLKRRLGMG